MNKATAVKLLKQHFSLFDIQSWMGDCSFIDKVAIECFKELVAKSTLNYDAVVNATTGRTQGHLLATQAYGWATEFVLAKLRFDNKPREDLEPYMQAHGLLVTLVKLRMAKDDIDAGIATPEQKSFYEANRDITWDAARTWFNKLNG